MTPPPLLARIEVARRRLPANVRKLGWVSLANDAASELAYPSARRGVPHRRSGAAPGGVRPPVRAAPDARVQAAFPGAGSTYTRRTLGGTDNRECKSRVRLRITIRPA